MFNGCINNANKYNVPLDLLQMVFMRFQEKIEKERREIKYREKKIKKVKMKQRWNIKIGSQRCICHQIDALLLFKECQATYKVLLHWADWVCNVFSSIDSFLLSAGKTKSALSLHQQHLWFIALNKPPLPSCPPLSSNALPGSSPPWQADMLTSSPPVSLLHISPKADWR